MSPPVSSLAVFPRRMLRAISAPSDSLRIAVDLSLLRPHGENGGIKPFIFEYLNALSRLEGDKVTFVFLTWSCSHSEVRTLARPHDELVCVRHTEGRSSIRVGDWRDGESIWLNPPPDLLIHLGAAVLYAPLGTAEFACPGIPLVATIADLLHRDFPMTLDAPIVALRESLFGSLIAAADRFQCISSHTAARMETVYGVDGSRIFRTYIVIHSRLDSTSGPVPALPAAQNYFYFPANAWRHKNHETLLVAFRLYRRAAGAAAWDLVLTGHDDERMRRVLACAQALGLGDSVRFLGHLSTDDLARVWRHAGALAFPSLHEGFGIPLLEAMHFGVPVLSHRETSLPEIGGEAALYADARDPQAWAAAMLQIASDGPLRQRLIASGRERLQHFCLPTELREFRSALRDAATSGASRLWCKGIHADGWTEQSAAVALPPLGSTVRLVLRIAPMPAGRRLRLYRNTVPFGGFELAAGMPAEIAVNLEVHGGTLRIEVPDAANLSASDHRQHGVLLEQISLFDAREVETRLYPPDRED